MERNGPRILLVDDDKDLLQLIALRLRAAGYSVRTAESAEAALASLSAERPHLVVSDLRMPDLDGISATREILTASPEVRVAVLTTFATVTLYVLSDRTEQLFAWTIQPPVTAAFLGAGYAAGLIAVERARLVLVRALELPADRRAEDVLLALALRAEAELRVGGEVRLDHGVALRPRLECLARLPFHQNEHSARFDIATGRLPELAQRDHPSAMGGHFLCRAPRVGQVLVTIGDIEQIVSRGKSEAVRYPYPRWSMRFPTTWLRPIVYHLFL